MCLSKAHYYSKPIVLFVLIAHSINYFSLSFLVKRYSVKTAQRHSIANVAKTIRNSKSFRRVSMLKRALPKTNSNDIIHIFHDCWEILLCESVWLGLISEFSSCNPMLLFTFEIIYHSADKYPKISDSMLWTHAILLPIVARFYIANGLSLFVSQIALQWRVVVIATATAAVVIDDFAIKSSIGWNML